MNSTNIYLPFNNDDTGVRIKKMDTSKGKCNSCRKKVGQGRGDPKVQKSNINSGRCHLVWSMGGRIGKWDKI